MYRLWVNLCEPTFHVSGIGRCTAVALSKAGYIVYEFSRRDVPVEGVRHMCVDVTDEASVQEAVGQILLERGSIEFVGKSFTY